MKEKVIHTEGGRGRNSKSDRWKDNGTEFSEVSFGN
jgi:hypothetical protein